MEYEALRNELLQWQSRRFTLVSTSAIVITALLGLEKSTNSQEWTVVSSALILFLACVCYLTSYCGASSRTLGTYLEHYHGRSKWEKRLQSFKSESLRKVVNLNTGLALIYLVMGLLAYAVPSNLFKNNVSDDYCILLLSAMILFGIVWTWLFLSSTILSSWLRKRDMKKWKNIP
jgi:hypothetical protein